MRVYKVFMDLSLTMARLKKYTLAEYYTEYPIIFVEANDPDDACYKAKYNLIRKIIKQDGSPEAELLCSEIMHDLRVIKAYVP
jgi:hypothetical protein